MHQKVILGIFFLLLANFVFADVIAPNTHSVEKCVTLNNIDSFQNYVIVGKITGPMINGTTFELNEIQQDTCLTKGYKFNRVEIYAIEKNYYETIPKESIDFNSVSVFKSNIDIEPYGGYVADSNPLTKVEIVYSIKSIKDRVMVLEKVSEINTPSSNPNQTNQNPNANKTQAAPIAQKSSNIFEIIACFFKGIFGMSC
jgi:hypothetical protein